MPQALMHLCMPTHTPGRGTRPTRPILGPVCLPHPHTHPRQHPLQESGLGGKVACHSHSAASHCPPSLYLGGFVPPILLNRKHQPPQHSPHPHLEIRLPPGGARLRGFQSLELSLTDSQVFVGRAARPPVQEECGDRGRGDCCPAAHPGAGLRVGLARPPVPQTSFPTERSPSETLTGCFSSCRLAGSPCFSTPDGTDRATQPLPAPLAPSRFAQAAPHTQTHPPGCPEESPSYRAPWGFAWNLSCRSPPTPRLRSGRKWRSCWWEQAGR